MTITIQRTKHIIVFASKVGGAIGTVTGIFNDFFIPHAPYGFYVSLVALSILLIASIVFVLQPGKKSIKEEAFSDSDSIWFAPFAASMLVISVVSFGAYQISKNYGDEGNGVLAENVPEIRDLQIKLGVLDEILVEQKKTNQILENSLEVQQGIANNTAESNDLQKITNKGVFWNQQTLQDALQRGDIETLEMFSNNGHDLSQVNRPASSAPLAEPMIIYAIRNNHGNIDQLLAYLDKNNIIDINALYKVNTVSAEAQAAWQVYMNNLDLLDRKKNGGTKFSTLQQQLKNQYGFIIPDNLKKKYENDFGFGIAGPNRAQNTLLVEAIWSENEKAVAYLANNSDIKLQGHIVLANGVKILLSAKREINNINNSQIQKLVRSHS